MELSRSQTCVVQSTPKLLQLALVTNGQVDKGGMLVNRVTIGIGVLQGCVSCLDHLVGRGNAPV